MEKYIIWIVVIIGVLTGAFITRNDYGENKSLTKKGFIKLMIVFAAIFLFIVLYVSLSGTSAA